MLPQTICLQPKKNPVRKKGFKSLIKTIKEGKWGFYGTNSDERKRKRSLSICINYRTWVDGILALITQVVYHLTWTNQ